MKKKFYILLGESKFLWRVGRLFLRLVHLIEDGDLEKASKKLMKTGKNNGISSLKYGAL
ncbi:MAG: hypothetical protein RBG13Loki_4054 [Promethearchaeota archaeon CR_4]|nr:MAG: hypothetical protein RBG13Loki_4054 [Candidatus Lokiarchaeota archaeon CR_4]